MLDDEIALRYYRLQQISQGDVVLQVADGGLLKGPTDVGTRAAKDEKAHLSEIIDTLNERFGTEFTQAGSSSTRSSPRPKPTRKSFNAPRPTRRTTSASRCARPSEAR